MSHFYTIKEVARLLRVSTRTVQRWIDSGKLPAFKPGGDWRVDADSLDAFIESSKYQPVRQK